MNNGYSIRYRNLPSELIEYENNRTNDLEAVTGYTCWEVPITENCQFDIGSKTNLYLFGDSHLSQLSLYFYSLKEVYDYNLYVLTGCIKYINSPTPNSKCVNQGNLNFYNEYLNNISNAYIVYFIFAEMEIEKYPKDFESYIENTLNKLIENNNKIILVYPAPVMNVSVAEYFLINNLDLNEVIKIDYNSFNKNQNIQNIYKIYNKFNNPNIIRIYPEEIFCNTYVKNSCVGSFDKKLFYYDNNHFSKDGAYLLGYKITSELFNIK